MHPTETHVSLTVQQFRGGSVRFTDSPSVEIEETYIMPDEQLTAKRSERRKNNSAIVTANHAVVSHEKWLTARTAFLAKEKGFH